MPARATPALKQLPELLEFLKMTSALFWGPDLETCRKMRAPDYFTSLDRLAARLDPLPRDVQARLKGHVKGFADAHALCNQLEEEYIPLFVNARGGIAAPLYQSCYPAPDAPREAASLMGAPAERMQARLTGRELGLANGLNEPPDHLAVEIEYLYFLIEKGWGQGDADLIAEAADFVKTEMLAWIPRFEDRLRAAAPNSFYTFITMVLVAVLKLSVDVQWSNP